MHLIKKLNPYLILSTAIVVGLFLVLINNRTENVDTPTKSATATRVANKAPESPPVPDTAKFLEGKIMEVITGYPGYNIGVSVKSLDSDKSSDIESDSDFIAASTTKIIVAAYTYQQADKGAISMDAIFYPKDKPPEYIPKSYRENVRLMIEKSDNEAWRDLKDHFGYKNIQKFANNAGAPSFNSVENIISANDMSAFLKELKVKPLLKEASLNELLIFMSNSWTGPLKLESSFQSLSKKTGWLEDRLHFVGYLDSNGQKMSFSIYTVDFNDGAYSYSEGSALINGILNIINANPI